MEAWCSGWYVYYFPGAEGAQYMSMHACKRMPGVQSMQSEGLPTGRQALYVLGWSCEQA